MRRYKEEAWITCTSLPVTTPLSSCSSLTWACVLLWYWWEAQAELELVNLHIAEDGAEFPTLLLHVSSAGIVVVGCLTQLEYVF